MSPNGKRCYVSNDEGSYTASHPGTTTVIDTATNTVVDTLAVGGNSVAVGDDGCDVYVINHGHDGQFTSTLSIVDTITGGITGVPVHGNDHRRCDRIAQPDSGIRPCQRAPGALMTQGRRHAALVALEHLGRRLDGRLCVADGVRVGLGVDARGDELAERLGQRAVERVLTLVLLRTDDVESEIHAHEPNTFRTTAFARRVTRR